jgi:hypothetical protein
MDKKLNQQLKDLLEKLMNIRENEDLTQEEREKLDLDIARISGQLLSPWLPLGIMRKILMSVFILIGFLGFISQYQWLIYSFIIAGFFSPRVVGETAMMIGKASRKSK